jgi:DNA-binding SARP family transcriptional activator
LPDADCFLRVERQTLSLQPDAPLGLDVIDFERAIARAEQAKRTQDPLAERQALEEAAKLYQGNLLPSCYDEWIMSERDRLSQLFLEVLERLLVLQEKEHDYQAAIRTAQRLQHHDPLHEAAYRHLMRLHAKNGNSAAVVRTYQTCAAVLERELGVRPSTATREAYERFVEEEELWLLPEVSHFRETSSTYYQREQTSQRTLVSAGYRSLR